MRSNRGLSEFASFPLLLIVALVIIIISVLMYAAEFSNETSSIDSGIQAATVGLLHAERDQVEAYLRTALDRSVRDGIARAYAYRSLACPISEQGLPIISDSCGYGYDAFVSSSERFASDRFSQVASDHPSAVLMDAQVTIDDRSRGEIRSALVFHETGSGSRIYEISRDIDSRELPIFLGSLEAFDHIPETITSEPELDFDSETPPYCADDPMNKEKAATFVRNTIEYCEKLSGTCSCGSVPLPEDERNRLEVRDGEVYLHEYSLGIDEDELEETFWIDTETTERLYVHRNDSGLILNTSDPQIPVCPGTVSTAAMGGNDLLSFDLSGSDIEAAPPLDPDSDLMFPEVEVYIHLQPHDGDRIEYHGDVDFARVIDLSLRTDESIFGLHEDTLGLGIISCVADPYLYDKSVPSTFGAEDEAVKALAQAKGHDGDVLVIRYPDSSALDCGSEPIEGARYGALLESLVRSIEHALEVHANPRRTRIVCIDDPIEEWVEINGEQQYASVYPTIAVPLGSDAIWPLEDIGVVTQCWGPPTEVTQEFYAYHRGIDLQPPGERLDVGTVFDRFTQSAVVSIDEGLIVNGWVCPYTVAESSITMGGSYEDRRDRAQELCVLPGGGFIGSGPDHGGFGEHVVIDHGGYYALYAHLAPGTLFDSLREAGVAEQDLSYEEFIQNLGQGDYMVERGTPLGLVGNTGTSTGAHLHFEVYSPDEPLIAGYRPSPPEGGYAPPATRFKQFNPMCALPNEVSGVSATYDISEKLPFERDVHVYEEVEDGLLDDDERSDEAFEASDDENCFFNYAMAYYNHNPNPETYGVCPVI